MSFVMIVIYYIGILLLVKKHLNKVDQKSTEQPSMSKVANEGPEVTGRKEQSTDGRYTAEDGKKFYGPICHLNEANRMKGRRKFEAEIAKRLFYIIASFVAFWIPYAFLVTALTEFKLLIIDDCDLTFELLFCTHILTTLSSVLNPLIYSLPNNQFRSGFVQLRKRRKLICM